MGKLLRATLNEAAPLHVQASNGQVDLFARVKIYDIAGTLVDTVSLPHITEGLYGATKTFTTEGFFTAAYQFFVDSGFVTPEQNFDIEVETIEANSDKLNILRILGLTHDNVHIDQHVYDANNNLTDARVRHYQTKTQALAGGATGLLNTWTVNAIYSGTQLQTYTVVRE